MNIHRGASLFSLLGLLVSLASPVLAHEEAAVQVGGASLDSDLATLGLRFVFITLAGVFLLLLISMAIRKPTERVKKLLFWGMTIAISLTTLTLIFMSVNLNIHSWSKGPIHWHADYQVWACGEELNLVDPTGFSNKIGTASRHEHNDNRLHYEGVVVTPQGAYLGAFFDVLGGSLTDDSFSFNATTGLKHVHNGESCADGTTGTVQTFVYRVNADHTYSQTKISNADRYLISHQSSVPPGDCIIVEFGPEKTETDKLCTSYKVAEEIGKIRKAEK